MDERYARNETSARPEVVVGTDGSATALRAVAWAATEARLRGRELRIVHVAPYADSDAGRRHARAILGRAHTVAHQKEPDAVISTELCDGKPPETLIATARDADLLVVGMVGERASDILVGSVATSVVIRAAGPVTVVRGHQRSHASSRPVVLAVADPDLDGGAVEVAFADANRHDSRLVVLHVAHGPHEVAVAVDNLETRLKPWCDRYPDVPIEVSVEHGPVIEALLGGTVRARMIVAGSRGRGAIAGAVLGSASRALVKLSTCPVTIVPRSLTATEARH
jgi:nucleotide-binding universal stress UspA family protein